MDDKSNEITAVPELLRVLDLAGCIVTIDAMGCQRKIAREIVEQGAHYVLCLKGNQGTMHTEVEELFASMPLEKIARGRKAPDARCAFHQTVDGDHGRVETRRCWRASDIGWFQDRDRWAGPASFGMGGGSVARRGIGARRRGLIVAGSRGAGQARLFAARQGC